MNKKSRFEELVEKYTKDSLTKAEFQEFIHMLNNSNEIHDLDDILTGYWHRIPKEDKRVTNPSKKIDSLWTERGSIKWRMAACFLVLMAAVALLFVIPSPTEHFTKYQTGFGEILNIELPDGSKVTLNANSELIWNNQWKRQGWRQVVLDGEAFFDIEKSPDNMTLNVETGDLSVEVVGTSFNVEKRNQKVEVYLDEGKVNLHMEHDLKKIITLEPGQKVKYDAGQRKIEKTINESMITSASWKKGILNFKDMEFREVLDKLKFIYGKSFSCEDENLLSKTIYLGVPYSDWEGVKQALELSLSIHMVESKNKVRITSN